MYRQVMPTISKTAVITYCSMGNTHVVKYSRFSIGGVRLCWRYFGKMFENENGIERNISKERVINIYVLIGNFSSEDNKRVL